MFKVPSRTPKGAKVLTKDELLELKDGAASIVPESQKVWGVECDQWCFQDLLLNALVMLSLIVVIVPLMIMNLRQRTGVVSVLFVALCAAIIVFMIYFIAITLTRRVWLVFSPGKIGWFRKSYWGSEKRIFDCGDITAIYHEQPDGGIRDERSLNIQLRSTEQVILLYDGGKKGLCSWVAALFMDAIDSKSVEFVNQPLSGAT